MIKGKILIASVFVFLAACIGAVIFAVADRYDYYSYENELTAYTADAITNSSCYSVVRDAGGTESIFHLNGQNTEVMRSLFTITERKRLYISPRYESAEKIEVYLSSEAKLTVIPKTNESEAGGDDEVYLITKLGNKSRVYYLSRYRVMSRLMEFVTQDAKYGTNEAVNRLPEGY